MTTRIKRPCSKGRGATTNPAGRFETARTEPIDDGWSEQESELAPLRTSVTAEPARSIITRNRSPDVPFELSINPYRGCEHGCVYCFARPSHAYLNLSPGLDFETKLFFKADAARLLEGQLAQPGYRCSPITLGANTDPYQPIERRLGVTRSILEVLKRYKHPVSIITKGALIERDLDLLEEMGRRGLASVIVSVTTLDNDLKRRLEPRAAAPAARLKTLRRLSAAGIPTGTLLAPLIPGINDQEIERILEACAKAGAETAGYVFIRLPYEVKTLFREWLDEHMPLKADHIMSLIRQSRGGKEYDSCFSQRMRGTGPFAELVRKRFSAACVRYGLGERHALDTSQFAVPGAQMQLF